MKVLLKITDMYNSKIFSSDIRESSIDEYIIVAQNSDESTKVSLIISVSRENLDKLKKKLSMRKGGIISVSLKNFYDILPDKEIVIN